MNIGGGVVVCVYCDIDRCGVGVGVAVVADGIVVVVGVVGGVSCCIGVVVADYVVV